MEALVALVLVGLVVVGTVEAVSGALRAQSIANGRLVALGLAETRLGEIAALPLDSLPVDPQFREGTFPPPFEGYRWRSLVQAVPGGPGLRGAAVMVEWEGGELALETVLYRRRGRVGTGPVRLP